MKFIDKILVSAIIIFIGFGLGLGLTVIVGAL
jgi:hypothetical protein